MNKKDMLKIQPCVLRVNIHCEGCADKVKKQLKKVEGVYKVSIDVDQGKVTVSGNVDPAALINRLEKTGKHAELWGGQKGVSNAIPMMMNNQFKNFQMEKPNGGKDGKGQKGGKGQQQKGGFGAPKEMMQLKSNEFKDFNKFMEKDKKSVKFNLTEEEESDYDDDAYFDESDDDGFDDEFDEGFAAHQQPSKVALFAGHGGSKASKATSDGGHQKGKNGGKGKKDKGGGGKGEKGKKEKGGGALDKFLKSMLGKSGAKTGSEGKRSKKGDKQQESGKNSKKSSGFPLDEGKDAAKNGKGMMHGGGGDGGKMNEKRNKKSGENFDGFPRMESKHPGFNNMNMNMNTGMMGQMPPNFPAVHRLPTGGAGPMNGGHFQGGFGQGNQHHHPFNNPQYMDQMRMMMMMNQQQQQQQRGAYNHNLGYMPQMPPPAMYGPPPPGSDQFTHMFSDENTGSCTVM